jgi:hypothetical protein
LRDLGAAARVCPTLRGKGVLIIALAFAATLVVGVGAASAAKSYSTEIKYLGSNGPIDDVTLYGELKTNPKCRAARQMELYRITNNGPRLADVDLSSFNGAWAFRAFLTGAPDIVIKAKKDTRNHGNVVCKGASIRLSANPMKH